MIEIKSLASSSEGNCYYINDSKSPLLLEAGISWKMVQRKLNFQTSGIKACLVTHGHGDHLGHIKDALKAGIDCYMTLPTAEAKGIQGHHRVKIIEPLKQFAVGSWVVLPFQTEHDCEGSVGYLLQSQNGEKCLFITDSYYCKYKFSGLNYILIECNYSLDILNENVKNGSIPLVQKNRILQSHFSLENVKKFLKANDLSQVKQIMLIHLSDQNSSTERFKREIEALTGKPVTITDK